MSAAPNVLAQEGAYGHIPETGGGPVTPVTLQDAYNNSANPAVILVTGAKPLIITAPSAHIGSFGNPRLLIGDNVITPGDSLAVLVGGSGPLGEVVVITEGGRAATGVAAAEQGGFLGIIILPGGNGSAAFPNGGASGQGAFENVGGGNAFPGSNGNGGASVGLSIGAGAGGQSEGTGTGGPGGSLNMGAGDGGQANGPGPAGIGGDFRSSAGNGGNATAAGTPGVGGNASMVGGQGGTASVAHTGGQGGSAQVQGGNGGPGNGGAGGNGGPADLDGGRGADTIGSTGPAGQGGGANVRAGDGGNTDSDNGGNGGQVVESGGAGGNASTPGFSGGLGGTAQSFGGRGGNASSGAAGQGGHVHAYAGNGGDGNAAGGIAGPGGEAEQRAGNAGQASGGANGQQGGHLLHTAGIGSANTSAVAGAAGAGGFGQHTAGDGGPSQFGPGGNGGTEFISGGFGGATNGPGGGDGGNGGPLVATGGRGGDANGAAGNGGAGAGASLVAGFGGNANNPIGNGADGGAAVLQGGIAGLASGAGNGGKGGDASVFAGDAGPAAGPGTNGIGGRVIVRGGASGTGPGAPNSGGDVVIDPGFGAAGGPNGRVIIGGVNVPSEVDLDASNLLLPNVPTSLFPANAHIDPVTKRVTIGTSLSFSQLQEVYVSRAGSDVSGDGSEANPWQTIPFAYAQITDAAVTKRYSMILGPGNYPENFAMKPWIFITGAGHPITTRITCPAITLDASFAPAGDQRGGMANLQVTAGPHTFDFNAIASNEGKLVFDNTQWNTKPVFIAFSAINQVVLQGGFMFAGYEQQGINCTLVSVGLVNGGDITLNSINDGRNVPTILLALGGGSDGTITANWAAGGANGITVELAGFAVLGLLTLNGADITVTDTNPNNFPGGVALVGSASRLQDPRYMMTSLAFGGVLAVAGDAPLVNGTFVTAPQPVGFGTEYVLPKGIIFDQLAYNCAGSDNTTQIRLFVDGVGVETVNINAVSGVVRFATQHKLTAGKRVALQYAGGTAPGGSLLQVG